MIPTREQSKHTPGPWEVRFHPSGDPEEFIVQAAKQPGQAVAQTIMEHTFYPTKLADARLIAASPEMLTKLQQIAAWLDRLHKAAAERAKDTRFQSLADANSADARNYKATADDIRKVISKALGGAQ